MLSIGDWFASIGKRSRPYQVRSIEKAEAALEAGRVPLIVAPTGAGKTVMACGVLRNHTPNLAAALVHTKTLRDQSANSIPGALIQTIQGLTSKSPGAARRVLALSTRRRAFIDEAHHIVSEEWIEAYAALRGHGMQVFGATATPERADGTPLGDVFNELISETSYSELVDEGNLVPCDIASPEHSRKEQRKKKIRPDAVAAYIKHGKRADGSWRPAIHFDRTKDDCYEAAKRFAEHGIRCAVITCDTPSSERQAVFDAFTCGLLDMLLSPQALAEGFDSRRAEVVVLNRTTSHIGGYKQMCGRVLRPYDRAYIDELLSAGWKLQPSALVPKERALLIDCCDCSSIHGKPTQECVYSLEGVGMQLVEETEEKDPVEREAAERARMVDMQYRMIRDQVRDTYATIGTQAKERGYQRGWEYHRFLEKTGLTLPREFEAKFASICKHCRHRVTVGGKILWCGPGEIYHDDCWFESLGNEALSAVDQRSPPKRRVIKGDANA